MGSLQRRRSFDGNHFFAEQPARYAFLVSSNLASALALDAAYHAIAAGVRSCGIALRYPGAAAVGEPVAAVDATQPCIHCRSTGNPSRSDDCLDTLSGL